MACGHKVIRLDVIVVALLPCLKKTTIKYRPACQGFVCSGNCDSSLPFFLLFLLCISTGTGKHCEWPNIG